MESKPQKLNLHWNPENVFKSFEMFKPVCFSFSFFMTSFFKWRNVLDLIMETLMKYQGVPISGTDIQAPLIRPIHCPSESLRTNKTVSHPKGFRHYHRL